MFTANMPSRNRLLALAALLGVVAVGVRLRKPDPVSSAADPVYDLFDGPALRPHGTLPATGPDPAVVNAQKKIHHRAPSTTPSTPVAASSSTTAPRPRPGVASPISPSPPSSPGRGRGAVVEE